MARSRGSYVKLLKRRLEYLETKLKIRDHTDKSKSYLDAEIGALKWALPILEREIQSKPESEADV